MNTTDISNLPLASAFVPKLSDNLTDEAVLRSMPLVWLVAAGYGNDLDRHKGSATREADITYCVLCAQSFRKKSRRIETSYETIASDVHTFRTACSMIALELVGLIDIESRPKASLYDKSAHLAIGLAKAIGSNLRNIDFPHLNAVGTDVERLGLSEFADWILDQIFNPNAKRVK